jgi:uncharacterized membrane protein YeaQ/YmgE (transglycosylase-associated protein family)
MPIVRHRPASRDARPPDWSLARPAGRFFAPEAILDIVVGIVVGLVAGLLTRAFTGSSAFDRLFLDVLIGVVGAVLGRWIFIRFALSMPVAGEPGTILVAVIGSVGLLLLLRILRSKQRMLW